MNTSEIFTTVARWNEASNDWLAFALALLVMVAVFRMVRNSLL